MYLSADGPFGREAFRFDLPGESMIVRAGWLALRQLPRAPTFPVLTHRDGKRQVIVIHPALPPPAGRSARLTVRASRRTVRKVTVTPLSEPSEAHKERR